MAKHAPFARGVSHLMYVGADDVDVVPATGKPSTKELGFGAVAAVVALQSRGITRLVSGGIAAWIGYKLYRSRKAA